MSERDPSDVRMWVASLPAHDPRFATMLAYLRGVRVTGRGSPVPRMLGEWALLGFLLQTGQISGGTACRERAPVAGVHRALAPSR